MELNAGYSISPDGLVLKNLLYLLLSLSAALSEKYDICKEEKILHFIILSADTFLAAMTNKHQKHS